MKCPSYFTGAILGSALAMTAYAKPGVIDDASPAAKQRAKVYIVQMASDPIAAYEGSIPGIRQTKPVKGRKVDADSADAREYAAHLNANHDAVLSAVGGRKIYDYNVVFNGFAAVLTPDQVQAMQARGDVLKVWEDELLQPHTNSTPDFLDLTGGGDPWSKGYVGEDVVIGIIDTGIQPDHPSVADVPTPKKGNKGPDISYDPAPASFTGSGCEFGQHGFKPAGCAVHLQRQAAQGRSVFRDLRDRGHPRRRRIHVGARQ